jgi:hypothetical protein
MCCANLYSFYCDPENIYIDLQFKNYTNIVDCTNDGLMITRWINLPNNIQYVIFLLSRSLVSNAFQVPFNRGLCHAHMWWMIYCYYNIEIVLLYCIWWFNWGVYVEVLSGLGVHECYWDDLFPLLIEFWCKSHIPYPSNLAKDTLLFLERIWWWGLQVLI